MNLMLVRSWGWPLGRMLKFHSNYNGAQRLNFFHGFRHLLLYSTSTSAECNPDFANYLVDFLGFSKQQALSTYTKLVRSRLARGAKKVSDFEFVENSNSVVKFLKQNGLEQCHIRTAVVSDPLILFSNVEKTLIPKTLAFQKMGFSVSDIVEVVKVNPSIFFMGLDTKIIPAFQALKEIMGCDLHVISIMKSPRIRLLSVSKLLVPNVALLMNHGIPIELIRKQLLRNPFPFLRKTEFTQDALIRVEEKLGIPRDSPRFLLGIMLLNSLKETTVESKRQIFKSFGWTESDVVTLTISSPFLLALSEANLKKRLGFFMNELGYKPSFLAKTCSLFTCSLEKRIVPRHKTLLVLKEKGLITLDYSLVSAVSYTESKFLEKFVLPFKEVHEVYSKHAGFRFSRWWDRPFFIPFSPTDVKGGICLKRKTASF
ncbi:transcription termination factor MTERF4, chloroplastic-like isoform X3 [Spinacia oleracea]|uniref:Transcription termination factor MTERF4, chloroplastic-like isoform X3 n=2 Tax=Spinacia oleracea TaxID=3562 RepID=A0ABM3QRX3_SPIOL|nr:transcription termination factor MTERF4, chloroplastic-like isoform X3 [Spinacia oleracea]